jgi:predicted kinase
MKFTKIGEERPTLYMLIGLPASGKSTWYSKNFLSMNTISNNFWLASTDNFIEQVALKKGSTYNEVFESTIKEAEALLYDTVKEALLEDADIVWDQTNLSKKSRAKKLAMIPDTYQKIAVYFHKPSDEEWERRLVSRPGKTIPKEVLKRMAATIEEPSFDEGFDVIILVKNVR